MSCFHCWLPNRARNPEDGEVHFRSTPEKTFLNAVACMRSRPFHACFKAIQGISEGFQDFPVLGCLLCVLFELERLKSTGKFFDWRANEESLVLHCCP